MELNSFFFISNKEINNMSNLEAITIRDCNRTRSHNNLVRKRTPNHLTKLAKWLSCIMNTYLYRAFVCFYHVTNTFQTSDIAPVSSKEFLDIQGTTECGFTLKRVRDMTRTYSHKKWSFPLRIYVINVSKSAVKSANMFTFTE